MEETELRSRYYFVEKIRYNEDYRYKSEVIIQKEGFV